MFHINWIDVNTRKKTNKLQYQIELESIILFYKIFFRKILKRVLFPTFSFSDILSIMYTTLGQVSIPLEQRCPTRCSLYTLAHDYSCLRWMPLLPAKTNNSRYFKNTNFVSKNQPIAVPEFPTLLYCRFPLSNYNSVSDHHSLFKP